MRKFSLFTVLLSVLLAAVLLFSGCAVKVNAENLMANVVPQPVDLPDDLSAGNRAMTDLAVRLLQKAPAGNTMISPVSILTVLALLQNGADKETLAELEALTGLSTDELNGYLAAYTASLLSDKGVRLHALNSLWINEDPDFTPDQSYLQTAADYYQPGIYKAVFDQKTVDEINRWCKKNTDGMIPTIIDELPDDTVMCLINALVFDGKWEKKYEKKDVFSGIFTKEDGTVLTKDFMYSEGERYFESEDAAAFSKYYEGSHYAFVGILPKEGTTLSAYLSSLTGDKLRALLTSSMGSAAVYLPKFSAETSLNLKEIFAFDLPHAFDGDTADFSRMGSVKSGNLYVNTFLHKTFIDVSENGTKAAAITFAGMGKATAAMPRILRLDRPFLYMIIDTQNNQPLFIGTFNG